MGFIMTSSRMYILTFPQPCYSLFSLLVMLIISLFPTRPSFCFIPFLFPFPPSLFHQPLITYVTSGRGGAHFLGVQAPSITVLRDPVLHTSFCSPVKCPGGNLCLHRRKSPHIEHMHISTSVLCLHGPSFPVLWPETIRLWKDGRPTFLALPCI